MSHSVFPRRASSVPVAAQASKKRLCLSIMHRDQETLRSQPEKESTDLALA